MGMITDHCQALGETCELPRPLQACPAAGPKPSVALGACTAVRMPPNVPHPQAVLRGHAGEVQALDFDAAERFLVSGCATPLARCLLAQKHISSCTRCTQLTPQLHNVLPTETPWARCGCGTCKTCAPPPCAACTR